MRNVGSRASGNCLICRAALSYAYAILNHFSWWKLWYFDFIDTWLFGPKQVNILWPSHADVRWVQIQNGKHFIQETRAWVKSVPSTGSIQIHFFSFKYKYDDKNWIKYKYKRADINWCWKKCIYFAKTIKFVFLQGNSFNIIILSIMLNM